MQGIQANFVWLQSLSQWNQEFSTSFAGLLRNPQLKENSRKQNIPWQWGPRGVPGRLFPLFHSHPRLVHHRPHLGNHRSSLQFSSLKFCPISMWLTS